MTAPELVAAQRRLDAFDHHFRSDALSAAVLVQARARVLARTLGEKAAAAHVRRDVAMAAAAGGDLSAVEEIVAAETERDAAERVRAQVVVPPLPADLVAGVLGVADRALSESDRALTVPALDVDTEREAWKRSSEGRMDVLEPPVVTDLERAAVKRIGPVVAEVEAARRHHVTWSEGVASAAGDPLDFLASAATSLDRRAELAARVAEATTVVERVNAARRRAGNNWTHPYAHGVIA